MGVTALNIHRNTAGYSGIPGKEYMILDGVLARVYFFDKKTGAYKGRVQLPSSAPAPTTYFNVAYTHDWRGHEDGLLWLMDCQRGKWIGYQIYECDVDSCGGCKNRGICNRDTGVCEVRVCLFSKIQAGSHVFILPTLFFFFFFFFFFFLLLYLPKKKCEGNFQGDLCADCLPGWLNTRRCDEDINECDQEPCGEGEICTNTPGSFECKCPEGYGGDKCQDDLDECQLGTHMCQNGATCTNSAPGYSCACVSGFTGSRCEVWNKRTKKQR